MYTHAGEFLWKADLFSTAEDISLGAEKVYVRTGDQRIAAVDGSSGAELWNTRISMKSAKLSVYSKPVITLQKKNIETLLLYNQHSINAYETESGSLLSNRPI